MNEKLIKKRLFKTRIVSRALAWLPFVRCVILNGSLASGGHKKSSDIDILIIAKTGRIFSARFFVNIFGIVFGLKRSKKDQSNHSGKFCFNYFLTEDFLTIPTGRGKEMDRYCAENYSASQFIAGDMKLYEDFMKVNQELFKTYNCHSELVSESNVVETAMRSRNKFGMTVLAKLGNLFEHAIKKYQIKKIESDPITKKYPNLIVYNDKELRFHPPKSELRIKEQ